MKNIVQKLLLFTLACTSNYIKNMHIVGLSVETITASSIMREHGHAVLDQQLYINGGVTFVYPVGLFTQTPIIVAVVEAAAHNDMLTYNAEVVSNSSVSTTIVVYKISDGGTVEQAATNEVTVHIRASGL